MRKLEYRIAIVTGASQGIGKAITFAFGQQGAKVVVTARTTNAIEAVANQLREIGTEALAITADLSAETDIRRIAEETTGRFGGADILVNNAAIIHPRLDLVDFDTNLWRQVIP